jgi:leader peptidase (prepilin peptidase)/N-methyltransferase
MAVTLLILILAGILIGGLLNALADDLPQHERPKWPHYPDGTPRPVSAWLGLTAFLLGQRRSPKGAKLGWRHPLTELATAAAFVVAYLATRDDAALTDLQFLFWLGYMAIFVLIVVIDVEHKLILFAVMIPAGIFAIVDAALTPVTQYGPTLPEALIGGAAGFIGSYLLYLGGFLFIRISGRMRGHSIDEVAFGYGDVMMFTLSGLILGPLPLLFAAYITVFAGAVGAILFLLGRGLRRRGYNLFTALPYGPYIVLGTTIMLLFSEESMRIMGLRW